MNERFAQKIENIHRRLMECYRETSNYPSSITGQEREIFNRELLQKILPSMYRIGAGTIVDSSGRETGQLDTVVELPFSLSFPVHSGENRLYLADTIGAAFEIKSNLEVQWSDAIDKIEEIKRLNRFKIKSNQIELGDNLKIPSVIIAYTGPKKLDTILNKFGSISRTYWPDGILVIKEGLFYGNIPGSNGVYEVQNKHSTAILTFISFLYETLQNYERNMVDLRPYKGLLND